MGDKQTTKKPSRESQPRISQIYSMMKVIICLAMLLPVLLGAHVFQDKQAANNVLAENKERVRRGGLQLSELTPDWFSNALDSVKDWEEFKEALEDTPLPEEQVDALERWVSACWWKDQAADLAGGAFEEKREDYVDAKANGLNPTRPVPCPQCCDVIPPGLGAQSWPYVRRTCDGVLNEEE